MKFLRRQNLNSSNVLDDTVLQRADGNIEFNPTDTTYVNSDIVINGTLSFGTEGEGGNLIVGDIAVNGGNLTTTATTFNLINANATTVNFAGDATTIEIGASTGTLTINNSKVILDSTASLQIPVGDISQRLNSTALGQIRYNSEIDQFEGYGPGGAWGSLGGVRSVDGLTQITAELSPGASDDILRFYAADVDNVTSKLVVTLNNESLIVLNETQSTDKDTGALIVEGGVGVEKTVHVGESVYAGDKLGFADTTGVSIVYQQYNVLTDSLDTIFG